MDKFTIAKTNVKCDFCKCSKDDFLNYGQKYKLGNFKAHYFCVLLSNRLIQNGNDNEGLLGFLLPDIKKELKRTTNVLCFYCRKGNANITCAAPKCKRTFHLPCGMKKGSSHQFIEQFKSFCHTHRVLQSIPFKIHKEACQTKTICCICQARICVKSKKKILWAPCCLKAWYHRSCLQKLAQSAGYFFKCAVCNDNKKFNEEMQRNGIFIPQQDASWEMVPNAFEELLFRYNQCDAVQCRCPEGRQSSTEKTMWEIMLCESCGSRGIHVACGGLKFVNPEWECPECQAVTKNINKKKISFSYKAGEGSSQRSRLAEVLQRKRQRDTEDYENSVLDKRKKTRMNAEKKEIEIDIDVETVEEEANEGATTKQKDCNSKSEKTSKEMNPQEGSRLAKPGPLSPKVALIRRTLGNYIVLAKEKLLACPKIIDLTDSDDEDFVQEIEKPSQEGCFHFKMEEWESNQMDGEVVILEKSKGFDLVTDSAEEEEEEDGTSMDEIYILIEFEREEDPDGEETNHLLTK